MDLTSALIAILIGAILTLVHGLARSISRQDGVLYRRKGKQLGGGGAFVNFAYFALGVLVSILSPEIRNLLGL